MLSPQVTASADERPTTTPTFASGNHPFMLSKQAQSFTKPERRLVDFIREREAGEKLWTYDPDGVRHNWSLFKAKLVESYEAPHGSANTQRELLELRQGESPTTYTTQFEVLCAKVN
ncbi:hypothetical protein KEM54_001866 [Ascosphaera aggregata]|nr:hypothetical protein KEM54_001866 [Ascosphaera aggregata]